MTDVKVDVKRDGHNLTAEIQVPCLDPIELSERDAELLAALLESPPEPNERLLAAARALLESEQIVSVSYFSRPIKLGGKHSPLLALAQGVLEVEKATAQLRKMPAAELYAFRDANLEQLRECVEALVTLTEELGGYRDL